MYKNPSRAFVVHDHGHCGTRDTKTEAAASDLLNKDMKPLSLSLLLLLSSVLLSSHLRPAAGRPRSLPGWLMDESGHLQTLEEPLRRVSGVDSSSSSITDLLDDNILKLLHRTNHPEHVHLLPPQEQEETDGEDLRTAAVAAAQLLKRSEDPQLSINLSLDMLRDMIHMAQMENQVKANRKIFDDIGK